jgi:GNAT superfamily N-acetyltransferase
VKYRVKSRFTGRTVPTASLIRCQPANVPDAIKIQRHVVGLRVLDLPIHRSFPMPAQPLTIQELVDTNYADWLPLWKGYQAFYKTDIPEAVTKTTWRRFMDPVEPMWALGAFAASGELVGIVHCIYHRSCWTEGDYCYLQDLFTKEGARNGGIGRALIEAVYARAKAHGASRVHWLTQETNAVGMVLYNKVADRSGFLQYRKIL